MSINKYREEIGKILEGEKPQKVSKGKRRSVIESRLGEFPPNIQRLMVKYGVIGGSEAPMTEAKKPKKKKSKAPAKPKVKKNMFERAVEYEAKNKEGLTENTDISRFPPNIQRLIVKYLGNDVQGVTEGTVKKLGSDPHIRDIRNSLRDILES